MYAKMVDGYIQYAPKKLPVTIEGQEYIQYNPTPETYAEHGYLPVRFTEHDTPPVGYQYTPTYAQVGDEIVQSWELVETDLSAEQALEIILGGESDEAE